MTDLESRLRDHGSAWRAAQPPSPELDVTSPPSRRALLRHPVVLGALAVAAAVAVALLAVPAHQPSRRVAAGPGEVVVPWKDDPVAPGLSTVSPPSKLPICAPADLHVGDGYTQPGGLLWATTVTNTGRSTCNFAVGAGSVSALSPAGSRVGLTAGGMSAPTHAELPPGSSGILELSSPMACGPDQLQPQSRFTAVEVALAGARLPLPAVVLLLCDDHATGSVLGIAVVPVGIPSGPGSIGTLKARTEGDRPASIGPDGVVPPGSAFDYVVVLSNPTDVDVPLQPCPAYTEMIGADPNPPTYRLNCDTVRLIPAHSEVRYQMRIRLPEGGLFMAFAWKLLPDGPNANGS